jgi:hypothetical protein
MDFGGRKADAPALVARVETIGSRAVEDTPRDLFLSVVGGEDEDHTSAASKGLFVEVDLILGQARGKFGLEGAAGQGSDHGSHGPANGRDDERRLLPWSDRALEDGRHSESGGESHDESDHATDRFSHTRLFGFRGRNGGVDLALGASGRQLPVFPGGSPAFMRSVAARSAAEGELKIPTTVFIYASRT